MKNKRIQISRILKNFFSIISLGLLATSSVQAQNFYAYYTHLKTNEGFEKYSRNGDFADIVLVINDMKSVFWHGTSYLPYFETKNGKWKVQEIIPRSGDGAANMPDAVNRFYNVFLIENSPQINNETCNMKIVQ